MRIFSILIVLLVGFGSTSLQASTADPKEGHHEDLSHLCEAGHGDHHGEFDPGKTAFHHISDANVYSIGPWNIPLPCIVYAPAQGWDIFLSNKFHYDFMGHGDGHKSYKGYVLVGGSIHRIADEAFPHESVDVHVVKDGDDHPYICQDGHLYHVDAKSTADGGIFGGGITSWYDFSLTKNVVTMLIVFGLLAWMFFGIARNYRERRGMAPKGIQSLIEPVFLFIQDEVAKPFLGDKYLKYLPFLMALFFFILGLNLFGQVPFLGSSNVTGNLAVTLVLAVFVFLVTNLSGTKDYWEHIFWMPGVPAGVKAILTPVEFLGVFIKPVTLMLRLMANITAGHMVLIIFISLIFMFGSMGENTVGGVATAIPAGALTIFMMAIELLVAFIQAFVFTILTASYIGAAIEEHHH